MIKQAKKLKLEKEIKLKKQPKQQFNKTIELEVEAIDPDEPEVKEVITSTFTPKERKELTKPAQRFKNMTSSTLIVLELSLGAAYTEQKNRWESEDRISKERKNYLQGLYDQLEDIKLQIVENEKRK